MVTVGRIGLTYQTNPTDPTYQTKGRVVTVGRIGLTYQTNPTNPTNQTK